VQTLLSDLRHALRSFRRSPALPTLTVLALGLGIGANTAVYSAADQLVLRSHRIPEPGRVVQIWDRYPNEDPGNEIQISVPNYEDYAAQQRVFEHFAVFQPGSGYVEADGRLESRPVLSASHELLPILGANPVVGRGFLPEESEPGVGPLVVISHGVWQEHYGGAPNVVGQTIDLTLWKQSARAYVPEPYEVVGVLPEGFRMPPIKLRDRYVAPATPDFVLPLGLWEWGRGNRGMYAFRALGRLAPGRQLSEARVEMNGIASRIARANPDTNEGYSVAVTPLETLSRDAYGQQVLLLWGAAVLLLLIGCANVAALLIGRAVARERELAIRKALGAGWGRVLRQLLAESGLLALAGGLAGLVLAFAGLRLLGGLAPAGLESIQAIGLDVRVFGFAILMSILTVVLFGVGPSLVAARLDVNHSIKTGGRTAAAGGLRSIRWLVTGEVALAFVLLTTGGLLWASLANMLQTDPGFDAEGRYLVSTAAFLPGLTKFNTGEDHRRLFAEIQEALEALPGVTRVALTGNPPLSGRVASADFSPGDRPLIPPEERQSVEWMRATPGYFATMGIPLLEGRELEPADLGRREPGAPGEPLPEIPILISEALARLYWPDESAVGKVGYYGIQDPATVEGGSYETGWDTRYPMPFPLRVVGVVGNVNQLSVDDPPRRQFYTGGTRVQHIVIQARGDAVALLPRIRSTIEGVDAELDVVSAMPFGDRVDAVAAEARFQFFLIGAFAFLSTVMAVLGLFGVMGYSVRQRMREIGIRISIGASNEEVQRMILRQGARLVGIGIALGLFGSWAMGRLVQGLLFGVGPFAPGILAASVVVMAGAALIGCVLPVRRAGRVDPVAILRAD
jgi:predicted permease